METTDIPEVEATPDEAFELGRISGYDEAMREAHYRLDVAMGFALRELSDEDGVRFLETWHEHFDEPEPMHLGSEEDK